MTENHKALSAEQSLPPRTELTARDVLVAARKLIEKPENWVQGVYRVSCEYGMAYCADGALNAVSPGNPEGAYTALKAAMKSPVGVVYFNDHHTHAEVLAAFDKAIAECST
jgi:hypothetical protein